MSKTQTILVGLATLCLLAQSAQAEVTKSDEGGFVTRNAAVVAATPKEVWLALISPGKWWSPQHTWSGDPVNLSLMPRAGGCFCERIPETPDPIGGALEGSAEHMRVLQAHPERALRMRGSLGPLQSEPVSGVLTISISEVEQGSRIVWEYVVGGYMRYEVGTIAPAVDAVMSEQLARLTKLLGPVEPTDEAPRSPDQPEPSLEDAIDKMADN